MVKKENESMLFHNPDAVTRISLWATIVSWILLGLAILTFGLQAYYIISNWAAISQSLPASIFDKIRTFGQLFLDSFTGVVYFLLLRGVSVGLNLLKDLFYGNTEDEEELVEEPAV
jgi:O-antigen/teichoic acid export membrane protein